LALLHHRGTEDTEGSSNPDVHDIAWAEILCEVGWGNYKLLLDRKVFNKKVCPDADVRDVVSPMDR
jgi:hypothetical protein